MKHSDYSGGPVECGGSPPLLPLPIFQTLRWLLVVTTLCVGGFSRAETVLAPIPIAKLQHSGAVDFEKEILPILKQNCLACHNQTKAKGALILETPQSILKGGDTGPGVVAKNPNESLVLRAASHQVADLEMPPPDNKVAASALKPEELGLLQLWIEQGAKGEVRGLGPIVWQALPGQINAIYAVALSADDHFVACGRGNRIFIYDLPCSRLACELADGQLQDTAGRGAAHRDTVNSLAFSPDGELLASGGYREVKIWRRAKPSLTMERASTNILAYTNNTTSFILSATTNGIIKLSFANSAKPVFKVNLGVAPNAMALRPDGKMVAAASSNSVHLWRVSDGKLDAEVKGDGQLAASVVERDRELKFAKSEVEYHKTALKTFEASHAEILARKKRAIDADTTNTKLLVEKQTALTNAFALQRAAIKALDDIGPGIGKLVEEFLQAKLRVKTADANALPVATNLLAQADAALEKLPLETREKRKSATEKLTAAKKAVADAQGALKPVEITKSAGDHELRLAEEAVRKSQDLDPVVKHELDRAVEELSKAEQALATAKKSEVQSEKPILGLAFSPDSAVVITADRDGALRVWSAETGAFCSTIGTVAGIKTVSFDSTGKLVAKSIDERFVWDLTPKWSLERTLGTGGDGSPIADRVNALRFTADSKFLVTGGGEPSREGEIIVWNLKDGKLAREFKNVHSDSVFALDLSPDGKYLASGSADRFARVIDFQSGKVLKTLEGHTHHVLGVAWQHDGRTLLTAGADGMAKTWDFATGERRKNIEGFAKEVTSVAFIGLGNQAFVTSGDGQVQIVDSEGKKIRSMTGSSDYIYAGAATSDGRTILAGGIKGVLRVWDGNDGKLIKEFKQPSY